MTKLERKIGTKIMVRVVPEETYCVRLYVGNQSFTVGGEFTHKSEANWMRNQLRTALVNLVNEVKPS